MRAFILHGLLSSLALLSQWNLPFSSISTSMPIVRKCQHLAPAQGVCACVEGGGCYKPCALRRHSARLTPQHRDRLSQLPHTTLDLVSYPFLHLCLPIDPTQNPVQSNPVICTESGFDDACNIGVRVWSPKRA